MSYKFNPFTNNFDLSQETINFSIIENQTTEQLEIPFGQEMLIKSVLMVRGILNNNGIIRSVKDDVEQMPHWHFVPVDKTVFIPENRTMFFKNLLRVEGSIRNNGIVEAL